MLLQQGETVEKVSQVYNELQEAYDFRKKEIDHLWDEIKIIKKLKIK